jgi:predicted nucleic acid-binding protein
MDKRGLGEEEAGYSGVVDVGIVLVSLFDNPLRHHALDFLEEVLSRKNQAAIPNTAFLGAYHIATRYLRCPRDLIAREIKETLALASPAFLEDIPPEAVQEAVDVAMAHGLESWDGYLVSLARRSGTPVIYSLDRGFEKVPDVSLVVPFPRKTVRAYHRWVKGLLGG